MSAIEYFQVHTTKYNDNGYAKLLPDGTLVTGMPIKESDANLIIEMRKRLSSDSIYYCYLGANKQTMKDLQHLCSSEGDSGASLVETIEESFIKMIDLTFIEFSR